MNRVKSVFWQLMGVLYLVFILPLSKIDWSNVWFKLSRSRTVVIFGGAIAGIAALFYTDQSPGAGVTLSLLLGGVATLIGIAMAHICRKALFDYKDADMSRLFTQASKSSTGSGLALIAVSIVLAAFLVLFSGFARAAEPSIRYPYATIEEQVVSGVHPKLAEYLLPTTASQPRVAAPDPRHTLPPPPPARPLLGTVLAQGVTLWPGHPYRPLVGALIEHESCISLTHSRCWNAASRLKTEKEEGAGLGQFHQGMESNYR